MEDVLHLYGLPYEKAHPVVCFDERPCVLHGEVVEPLVMKPGTPKRHDYEYVRRGTCCLLIAFEPLSGFRMVEVSARRTAEDYACFMEKLSEHYRHATRIRLVQDNLNTHTASSFYKHLPASEAFALAQRFEFHHTPKKASWLNMAEIELSVLVRQCLGRRIESQQRMPRRLGSGSKNVMKKARPSTGNSRPWWLARNYSGITARCVTRTNMTEY